MQRLDTDQGLPVTNLFGYNPRSEVTNAVMGANAYGYAYDPIGNRTGAAVSSGGGQPDVTAYAANLLNQYAVITNSAFSASPRETIPAYDADGNMLTNGPWAYTWDAENRMTAAISNNVLRVVNTYDHQSRRIKKEVFARANTTCNYEPVTMNQFLYDGWNVVRETVAAGGSVATNYYTWGLDLSGTMQGAGGVGGLLAVTKGDGSVYYPCYDANGNTTAYVDGSGAVVAQREYDAFGNTVSCTGSVAGEFAYWFSTKCWDAETGLYYYGYRFYSSELGRWVSRDTIGEKGALNIYSFCNESAINEIDPLGLWGTDVHRKRTLEWAIKKGMSNYGAARIADQDEAVDSSYGGFAPWVINNENWSWHFDRSNGGNDSRLDHFEQEIRAAMAFCNWKAGGSDNWIEAGLHMGRALHPLQDWVAHGDFNRAQEMPTLSLDTDIMRLGHNFDSPARWGVWQPDNPNLDATGADGRATFSVMHPAKSRLSNGGQPYWAFFMTGNRRINLTERRTNEALSRFMQFIKSNSKPCGECQKAFN